LNSAYPHPLLFGNLLLSFSIGESLLEDVWHIHGEGGLRALLRLPLELDDLGAIRERLAVARNAGLVRLDHRRVGDDDLEHFVGAGGRDDRPVLVSPEVGERDSAQRFQRVLVLRAPPARTQIAPRSSRSPKSWSGSIRRFRDDQGILQVGVSEHLDLQQENRDGR
jgi:hypothetical protein